MRNEDKVLEDFYEFCLTTCSVRRIQKIKNVMEKSREIIKKDLTKLDIKDVVKFLSQINQSNYKEWTKNDYKKIFKRFVKWYYKDLQMVEGKEVKDGFKCTSKKKAFNKEKINKNTLIKPKELEKLLRAANSLKWKALISLMYESALRPCEIRNLKWKDCTFEDSKGICKIWTLSPKTKDSRTVPVKDCVVHLKRWREEFEYPERIEKDYVFPSPQNREKPLGDGVITQMFTRICKKAGIRPLFAYMLRHTRIYEIQKRLGEKLAAKFAGHSVETSEIYNHLDSDDVEEAMLENVYVTEELSPEKKQELEKQVQQLTKRLIEVEQQVTDKFHNSLIIELNKDVSKWNEIAQQRMKEELEQEKKILMKKNSKNG